MNILVTNDDGIHADGLRALAKALRPLGTVTVIAPDREQSAASHALTLHRPLRIKKVEDGVLSVDGTPTDCVLLAVHGFLKQKPDLVVSGINHGPNMGNDTAYSGTVAAAVEGTFLGIPSVAVSLATWEEADFEPAGAVAADLVKTFLEHGIRPGMCISVNIPPIPREAMKGVRVTRLGKRVFRDVIVEKTDPRGKLYYWIGGEDPTWEPDELSDFNAVSEGYVSATPLLLELTDTRAILEMEQWGLKLAQIR
jgi:5'-nucleotidase